MESLTETAARIVELESRQDEAIKQLADLERRLELVLAEYTPANVPVAGPIFSAPDAPMPAAKAA